MNKSLKKSKEDGEVVITTPDGKRFTVPPEGSIGLLALGAVGLKAWRIARQNAAKKAHTDQASEEQKVNEKPEE